MRRGDETAFARIWEAFFPRLVRLAYQRLNRTRRRVYDEEDAALSAFHSFFREAQAGELLPLDGRNDLWRLLTLKLMRKIVSRRRADAARKRGGDQVRGDSAFAECGPERIHAVTASEPGPEFVVDLIEEADAVLAQLAEPLRRVVLLKMNGLTNAEVAAEVGLTTRSVERKLEQVRRQFAREDVPGAASSGESENPHP